MITVKVGSRHYEVDEHGNPKPGTSRKYPEGDCRSTGPSYVHYQRSSRVREERRERMTEAVRKAGYKSLGAMLNAQRMTGGERAPKHPERSKAFDAQHPELSRKQQRAGKTTRKTMRTAAQALALGLERRATERKAKERKRVRDAAAKREKRAAAKGGAS